MNELLQAAKAVIEVWDAGRGVWDQISALRAAVERAEKHEGVGFDKYWRKEKYRWDKNLQRDVQAVWTDAKQAERERIKDLLRQSDDWFEDEQMEQAKWLLEKIDATTE